jgi:hypothetical protein
VEALSSIVGYGEDPVGTHRPSGGFPISAFTTLNNLPNSQAILSLLLPPSKLHHCDDHLAPGLGLTAEASVNANLGRVNANVRRPHLGRGHVPLPGAWGERARAAAWSSRSALPTAARWTSRVPSGGKRATALKVHLCSSPPPTSTEVVHSCLSFRTRYFRRFPLPPPSPISHRLHARPRLDCVFITRDHERCRRSRSRIHTPARPQSQSACASTAVHFHLRTYPPSSPQPGCLSRRFERTC